MGERWIFHLDLDAFFASVEEVLNPELRGRPLIVGGRPDERGVVSSASYAARRYGVRSAMPTAQALRLCPHAVLVSGRHGTYSYHSRQVMDLLRQYTPLVEQISIDEAFLDVTGCQLHWGPPLDMAAGIQQRILEELKLSASIGIAGNKLVAKIASDYRKPYGLTLVPHGQEAAFLAPLAIERLPGVGIVTARKLHLAGIRTIGALAGGSLTRLERLFGQHGAPLWLRAQGIDDRRVESTYEKVKSISHEETFVQDVCDPEQLQGELLQLSEKVGARLRRLGWQARTVAIKLRYEDFSTITRQLTLEEETDIDAEIYSAAVELWRTGWERGRSVRLIGVGVHNLVQGSRQLELFRTTDAGAEREKLRKLETTVDQVRERYGSKALVRAALLRRATPGAPPVSRRTDGEGRGSQKGTVEDLDDGSPQRSEEGT